MKMNIMKPETEKINVKVGNLVVDIGQVIRNLTGTEVEEEKKSVLQKLLDTKKVEDSNNKEEEKAIKIAKKIARGESVTSEEKALLIRVNPRLAQMAELAKKEGERIKYALQQASSKEEQQTIVQQAYQQVTEVTKTNPQFGMLLGEAVKAAIQEAKEEPKQNMLPEISEEQKRFGQLQMENSVGEEQKLSKQQKMENLAEEKQNEIMEQFYPDEWVSMLDCKG